MLLCTRTGVRWFGERGNSTEDVNGDLGVESEGESKKAANARVHLVGPPRVNCRPNYELWRGVFSLICQTFQVFGQLLVGVSVDITKD